MRFGDFQNPYHMYICIYLKLPADHDLRSEVNYFPSVSARQARRVGRVLCAVLASWTVPQPETRCTFKTQWQRDRRGLSWAAAARATPFRGRVQRRGREDLGERGDLRAARLERSQERLERARLLRGDNQVTASVRVDRRGAGRLVGRGLARFGSRSWCQRGVWLRASLPRSFGKPPPPWPLCCARSFLVASRSF